MKPKNLRSQHPREEVAALAQRYLPRGLADAYMWLWDHGGPVDRAEFLAGTSRYGVERLKPTGLLRVRWVMVPNADGGRSRGAIYDIERLPYKEVSQPHTPKTRTARALAGRALMREIEILRRRILELEAELLEYKLNRNSSMPEPTTTNGVPR